MHQIILVDDDQDIRELLRDYLNKNGFNTQTFDSAESLLQQGIGDAELIILDVGLPGMDGFDLCRQLRVDSEIPIIMLTAASDDVDRILGLELGADDYMSKPFNPRELLARLKALLRRTRPRENTPRTDQALQLNITQRTATLSGQTLELTGAEFDLLQLLQDHSGEVVSRNELSLKLKGHPVSPFDRSIDTLVSRLRSKLSLHTEQDPIKSVRGKGYLLVIK